MNSIKLNKVELIEQGEESYLSIPNYDDDKLPSCTIITPTYNRSLIFDIAVRNYKRYNYPRHKLYWLILDDSNIDEYNKLKLLIDTEFKNDNSVQLIHVDEKMKIGKKRNMLADLVKTEIICHQDDDDFYYPDSVRIRVITLLHYKLPVCGCIEYNCYNIIDDSQFIARGSPDKMNIGEATLCYSKNFWRNNKYNDDDTHEESIYFLKNVNGNSNSSSNNSLYIDIPCLWIHLGITHGKNVSGRNHFNSLLNYSFIELLPIDDYNFIKNLKLKLMMNDPQNKRLLNIAKSMQEYLGKQDYTKINKLVDTLKPKERKNCIIKDFLHNVPSKTNFSDKDFLILCFPGKYCKNLKFEEENELIEFIKNNKNKYRFTIYTDCESGKNFDGITISPFWKWRSANRYNYCLVYGDPSHFKNPMNINKDNVYFYNKYDFNVNQINGVKEIKNFQNFEN